MSRSPLKAAAATAAWDYNMSKRMTGIIFLLVGFLFGVGVLWFSFGGITGQELSLSVTGVKASSETDNTERVDLVNLAIEINNYLRDRNYEALSGSIHPEYNLVFSPYATINLTTAKWFSADEVKRLGRDDTVYTWGTFDGTTKPIEMVFDEYYEKFIYDKDYSLAPIISVNNIVESGNALENIEDVFPEAQYVEFHYPNSDISGENSDWGTLRLVFERYNDTFALTAIVHSAWTA